MADPEDFGSWLNSTQDQSTVALPKLPDEIDSAISGINGILEVLSQVLDFALTLLDAVSAFLVGNLDPVVALIEALVAEVESIINDLRNAGLYLTGDWYQAEFPFDRLQGGFSNYQIRTLGRMLDRNDPTRPDIPEGQPVLGVFLYHSTDIGSITSLLRFLTQLVDFFSFDLSFTKTLQTPSNLRVKYGTPDTNFRVNVSLAETFGSTPDVLDVANVQWELSAPTLNTPLVAAPLPPPDGFLVTVSTVKDGLGVYFDRPRPNSVQVPGPSGPVQDREVGRVLNPHGKPLQLFGGLDEIDVDSSLSYNNTMAGSGEVKAGASRVWVQKSPADPLPIPISELRTSSGFPLLQRTFFVPTPTVSEDLLADGFLQRTRFGINLNVTQMPLDATFVESDGQVTADPSSFKRAETYYVRVAAVSGNVLSETDFKYRLDGDTINVPGKPYRAKYGTLDDGTPLSKADRGEMSAAATLNYPSPDTRSYIDLVAASLAVLVLSRSDLQVGRTTDFEDGKAAQGTGLESFAALIPRILNVQNPDDFFNMADEDGEYSDAWDFRASLLHGCRLMAAEMYRTTGSNPALEAELVSSAGNLLTFTWDQSDVFLTSTGSQGSVDYPETILGSLDDGSIPEGVVRNPECAGLGINRGTLVGSVSGADVSVDTRLPGFYQRNESGFVVGSADRSPCLNVRFNDGSYRMFYCRNAIPEDVLDSARQVLGVASPAILRDAADGEWISVRVGQLLPSLDGLLDTVLEWARSFAQGVANAVDAVQAYIEFLESRILELQGLLNRIQGLTADIIPIQLPQFSALFLLGSGTQDIITQFSQAGNPPVDGTLTYGGGVTLLAVAPPDFIIDLFVQLLSAQGQGA